MAVMLKRQRDETFRSVWYGEYTDEHGKRKVINTGVRWLGTPPESGKMRDRGSDAFEKSRYDAETALDVHRNEAARKGNAAHLVERLIEAKTGRKVEHVQIDGLAGRWLSGKRKSAITKVHTDNTRATFARFAAFMKARRLDARQPEAVYLYEVTPEDTDAYIETLCRDLAPRTARGHAALLRSAFKRFLPVGAANPFDGFGAREKNDSGTVHRRPFTAVELQALIVAAGDDELMRDLITTGACTGLRRGDLGRLRWDAVDMAAGMVTVKTSKTGEMAEVPLFDPLRAVLESRKGNGSEFVFPEAADMLERNPVGLTYRFKLIAARALDTEPTAPPPEITDAAEIEAGGVEAIRAHVAEGPRRERMLEAFRRYCAGATFREIEKETGIPRGVVSVDLRAVEGWTGKRFVRSVRGPDMKAKIARITRVERAQGQYAASVYDWHALRTTFVTLALSAGVPMELVRRVTGHQTTAIVLDHYYRPGREDFRAALSGALPEVLTGRKSTGKALPPTDEMAAILDKVKAGSATDADKKRLRLLAAKV